MEYDHCFGDALKNGDLGQLSIAFTARKRVLRFGGCAGNIAYTLKLLGGEPLIAGRGGKDFGMYEKHLDDLKIMRDGVVIDPEEFTAAAYILNDADKHQLVIFSAGAMISAVEVDLEKIVSRCARAQIDDEKSLQESHLKTQQPKSKKTLAVDEELNQPITWAIISPDNPDWMAKVGKFCTAKKIRYIFDPGQQVRDLTAEQLSQLLLHAEIMILNEHELEMLFERLKGFEAFAKYSLSDVHSLLQLLPTVIVTEGEKGSTIYTKKTDGSFDTIKIAAFTPVEVVDPTGAGDAYRAGLLAGLNKGESLTESCHMGALAATYCVEKAGCQEHTFTLSEFETRLGESKV